MMNNALHTHIIASRFDAPLLIESGGGLIVEITDGNTFGYRGNYLFDVVKSSVIRLAFVQAFELWRKNVAALAADARVMDKSGRVFSSWDLSDECGFSDMDGSRPHWGRHSEKAFGKPLQPMDAGFYAYGKDSSIEAVMPDWP